MNANIIVDPKSHSTFYEATDSQDPNLGITGRLRDGVVSFVVEADKTKGSVSGREFFNATMQHFDPDNVTVIVGDWRDSDPAFTANLDTFNALTKSGSSEQEAATKTWTGQRGKDWGYTLVEIVRALPINNPGNYRVVTVYFKRPS